MWCIKSEVNGQPHPTPNPSPKGEGSDMFCRLRVGTSPLHIVLMVDLKACARSKYINYINISAGQMGYIKPVSPQLKTFESAC